MRYSEQVEFQAGAAFRNQYLMVAGLVLLVPMVLTVVGGVAFPPPWGVALLVAVVMSSTGAVFLSFIASSRGVVLTAEGLTIRGFNGYATPARQPGYLVRGFWTTQQFPWSHIRSITEQRFHGYRTVVELIDGTRVRTFAPTSLVVGRDPNFHSKVALMQQWHTRYAGSAQARTD
jgi:hypothetical protein